MTDSGDRTGTATVTRAVVQSFLWSWHAATASSIHESMKVEQLTRQHRLHTHVLEHAHRHTNERGNVRLSERGRFIDWSATTPTEVGFLVPSSSAGLFGSVGWLVVGCLRWWIVSSFLAAPVLLSVFVLDLNTVLIFTYQHLYTVIMEEEHNIL